MESHSEHVEASPLSSHELSTFGQLSPCQFLSWDTIADSTSPQGLLKVLFVEKNVILVVSVFTISNTAYDFKLINLIIIISNYTNMRDLISLVRISCPSCMKFYRIISNNNNWYDLRWSCNKIRIVSFFSVVSFDDLVWSLDKKSWNRCTSVYVFCCNI